MLGSTLFAQVQVWVCQAKKAKTSLLLFFNYLLKRTVKRSKLLLLQIIRNCLLCPSFCIATMNLAMDQTTSYDITSHGPCQWFSITVNPFYTNTQYNDEIRYSDNLTGMKPLLKRWGLIRN